MHFNGIYYVSNRKSYAENSARYPQINHGYRHCRNGNRKHGQPLFYYLNVAASPLSVFAAAFESQRYGTCRGKGNNRIKRDVGDYDEGQCRQFEIRNTNGDIVSDSIRNMKKYKHSAKRQPKIKARNYQNAEAQNVA